MEKIVLGEKKGFLPHFTSRLMRKIARKNKELKYDHCYSLEFESHVVLMNKIISNSKTNFLMHKDIFKNLNNLIELTQHSESLLASKKKISNSEVCHTTYAMNLYKAGIKIATFGLILLSDRISKKDNKKNSELFSWMRIDKKTVIEEIGTYLKKGKSKKSQKSKKIESRLRPIILNSLINPSSLCVLSILDSDIKGYERNKRVLEFVSKIQNFRESENSQSNLGIIRRPKIKEENNFFRNLKFSKSEDDDYTDESPSHINPKFTSNSRDRIESEFYNIENYEDKNIFETQKSSNHPQKGHSIDDRTQRKNKRSDFNSLPADYGLSNRLEKKFYQIEENSEINEKHTEEITDFTNDHKDEKRRIRDLFSKKLKNELKVVENDRNSITNLSVSSRDSYLDTLFEKTEKLLTHSVKSKKNVRFKNHKIEDLDDDEMFGWTKGRLVKRVKELEEKENENDTIYQNFKLEFDDAQNNIVEAGERLKEFKKVIDDMSKELKLKNVENKKLILEQKNISNRKVELEFELEKLSSELGNAKKFVVNISKENKKMKLELQKLRLELGNTQDQRDFFNNTQISNKKNFDEYRREIEKKIEEAQTRLMDSKDKEMNAIKEKEELKIAKREFEKKLEIEGNQRKKLNKRVVNLETRLNGLVTEKYKLENSKKNLEIEDIENKKCIELLRCELDISQKKFKNAESEVSHLLDQIGVLRKENTQLHNGIIEKDKDNFDLKKKMNFTNGRVSEYDLVKAENKKLKNNAMEIESKMQNLRIKNKNYELNLIELESLREENLAKEEQIRILKTDFSSAQSRLAQIQSQIPELKNTMTDLEEENKMLFSENEKFQLLLQDSQNDCTKVKTEYTNLKEIYEKQTDEIETLDKLANQYKNSWKIVKSELRHLKRELEVREERLMNVSLEAERLKTIVNKSSNQEKKRALGDIENMISSHRKLMSGD